MSKRGLAHHGAHRGRNSKKTRLTEKEGFHENDNDNIEINETKKL